MSGGTNNFTPTLRNWQVGHDYGANAPHNRDWNRRQAPVSRFGSASLHTDPDANRGALHAWHPSEQREVIRPFGLAGFPVHAHSPVEIPIVGNLMARDIHPIHRQITQGSTPGIVNWQNTRPTQEDNSRLARDEQNAVLKKLKKQIYYPSTNKLMTRGSYLYYRDQAIKFYNEMEKQKENDSKRCAICLEDFEAKEMVMLTPCNHMYHENCIVPWVRSHAKCPVCRFSFGEKSGENASDNTMNIANAAGDDLFATEIMSVIRAMEEDFIWNNAVL